MNILAIQQRYSNAGFQWIEHIFNDGLYRNCHIIFTKSRDPGYFRNYAIGGDFGWGRFEREEAWRLAGLWLDAVIDGEIEGPSPRTTPYNQ